MYRHGHRKGRSFAVGRRLAGRSYRINDHLVGVGNVHEVVGDKVARAVHFAGHIGVIHDRPAEIAGHAVAEGIDVILQVVVQGHVRAGFVGIVAADRFGVDGDVDFEGGAGAIVAQTVFIDAVGAVSVGHNGVGHHARRRIGIRQGIHFHQIAIAADDWRRRDPNHQVGIADLVDAEVVAVESRYVDRRHRRVAAADRFRIRIGIAIVVDRLGSRFRFDRDDYIESRAEAIVGIARVVGHVRAIGVRPDRVGHRLYGAARIGQHARIDGLAVGAGIGGAGNAADRAGGGNAFHEIIVAVDGQHVDRRLDLTVMADGFRQRIGIAVDILGFGQRSGLDGDRDLLRHARTRIGVRIVGDELRRHIDREGDRGVGRVGPLCREAGQRAQVDARIVVVGAVIDIRQVQSGQQFGNAGRSRDRDVVSDVTIGRAAFAVAGRLAGSHQTGGRRFVADRAATAEADLGSRPDADAVLNGITDTFVAVVVDAVGIVFRRQFEQNIAADGIHQFEVHAGTGEGM